MVRPEAASRAEAIDLVTTNLLSRASRLTRLLMKSGPRELTRTEIGVLTSLDERPRRITELADTEAVAQPTVSKLVDRLEGRGLVTRQSVSGDGRGVVVCISAEGRLCLEAARSRIRSLLRERLLELDDGDLAALVVASEAMAQLISVLQHGDGDS